MRQPAHVDVRVEQLADRLDVDHRRLEEQVAHRLPVELLVQVGEHAARERQAVRVDAARGDADDRVARLDPVAGHDRVEVDEADAEAHEVEAVRRRMPAHDLGQHGELAARDLDAGQLGAGAQADADLLQHLRVRLLDGDVVEQRDRVRARRRSRRSAFIPNRSMPIVS